MRMFNEKEFNIIVNRYYQTIYSYCLSKLRYDDYYASEITNDVFNLLSKKWDELEREDKMLAWLYKVANNYIKKYWTRQKRNREESLEAAVESGKLENNDLYYTTIDADANIDVPEELTKIVQRLPDDLKQLFIYKVIEEKTFAEICSITGLPYTTVNNRVKKAQKIAEKIVNGNYF